MLLVLSSNFVNDSDIKQIVQVISINFQELNFHTVLIEVWLLFPIFNLWEDKVEDSGYNANLLVRETNSASSSHGVRLSTTCLAIGKDCRIVTLEAS